MQNEMTVSQLVGYIKESEKTVRVYNEIQDTGVFATWSHEDIKEVEGAGAFMRELEVTIFFDHNMKLVDVAGSHRTCDKTCRANIYIRSAKMSEVVVING